MPNVENNNFRRKDSLATILEVLGKSSIISAVSVTVIMSITFAILGGVHGGIPCAAFILPGVYVPCAISFTAGLILLTINHLCKKKRSIEESDQR